MNIIDLMKSEVLEEIRFDGFIDSYGEWIKAEGIPTSPQGFDYCIQISSDNIFDYYLAWDKRDTLNKTVIFRKKKK